MMHEPIEDRFRQALEALVEQVKQDRSILAAILCGSLSHDKVWAKSDIDLVLVTIDDKKVPAGDLALYADGLNVHTALIPRAEFRKTAEGSIRNSFMHALLTKGRLLFTHDDTIADLCARMSHIGDRDTQVQLLRGDPRDGTDLQGSQVARYPRRPRLHFSLDPLRRDAAGTDRSRWPQASRRPRGHSPGNEVEPRVF